VGQVSKSVEKKLLIRAILRVFALSRFRDQKRRGTRKREKAKARKKGREGDGKCGKSIFRQKGGFGDPNLALFRCAEIAKKREKSF
jgi:hypothetical protein